MSGLFSIYILPERAKCPCYFYFFFIMANIIVSLADWIWGIPLLVLVVGGGLFFLFHSSFIPFRMFWHALDVLRGKHDDPNAAGQINHYEALSTALAATVGMGNISGVAVAITIGGPGAILWMWVSAFVGMATKYYTCTLAILFRGKDSKGQIQGGPMYVITEGLGQKWKPLAIIFCLAGIIGCLPAFTANQLTQAVRDIVLVPAGFADGFNTNVGIGLVITLLVILVIFGGLQRISKVASRMVPIMVVLYFVAVLGILLLNMDKIPRYFYMILANAFTAENYNGDPVLGGALGGLIILGTRRAAFSNEAGIGTAPMAHGAAKTNEPVHEGLVAMLGPAIDTLLVCTLTALAILVTDVWMTTADNGVTLTANAFAAAFPSFGSGLLFLCVLTFGLSSLFTYAYFGTKCWSFLAGADKIHYYNYFYTASVIVAATASLSTIISLIDLAFAIMAIPTIVSTILLAPKVRAATLAYLAKRKMINEAK